MYVALSTTIKNTSKSRVLFVILTRVETVYKDTYYLPPRTRIA